MYIVTFYWWLFKLNSFSCYTWSCGHVSIHLFWMTWHLILYKRYCIKQWPQCVQCSCSLLRPWRHRSGSTSSQAMACCLTAPSHYLNQCWLITNGVLWYSPYSNFTGSALRYQFMMCQFENYDLEIMATSRKGQWVNWRLAKPLLNFSNILIDTGSSIAARFLNIWLGIPPRIFYNGLGTNGCDWSACALTYYIGSRGLH